jgi:hypothetical protein
MLRRAIATNHEVQVASSSSRLPVARPHAGLAVATKSRPGWAVRPLAAGELAVLLTECESRSGLSVRWRPAHRSAGVARPLGSQAPQLRSGWAGRFTPRARRAEIPSESHPCVSAQDQEPPEFIAGPAEYRSAGPIGRVGHRLRPCRGRHAASAIERCQGRAYATRWTVADRRKPNLAMERTSNGEAQWVAHQRSATPLAAAHLNVRRQQKVAAIRDARLLCQHRSRPVATAGKSCLARCGCSARQREGRKVSFPWSAQLLSCCSTASCDRRHRAGGRRGTTPDCQSQKVGAAEREGTSARSAVQGSEARPHLPHSLVVQTRRRRPTASQAVGYSLSVVARSFTAHAA